MTNGKLVRLIFLLSLPTPVVSAQRLLLISDNSHPCWLFFYLMIRALLYTLSYSNPVCLRKKFDYHSICNVHDECIYQRSSWHCARFGHFICVGIATRSVLIHKTWYGAKKRRKKSFLKNITVYMIAPGRWTHGFQQRSINSRVSTLRRTAVFGPSHAWAKDKGMYMYGKYKYLGHQSLGSIQKSSNISYKGRNRNPAWRQIWRDWCYAIVLLWNRCATKHI